VNDRITKIIYCGSIGRYAFAGIANGVEIGDFTNTPEEALKQYQRLAARLPRGKHPAETIAAALTDS